MYTIFSPVLCQQRKSDVMTYLMVTSLAVPSIIKQNPHYFKMVFLCVRENTLRIKVWD
jgi:hypothetical protein